MKSAFYILIFLAVFFEIIADVLFKYWSINAKNTFFVLGIILYSIGTVIWAYSLKYEDLSKAIIIFTIINLITITLVGMLIFKEQLSLVNKIGILVGIISVILIEK